MIDGPIVIENVKPTPHEMRPVRKGWGGVHWASCLPTYAYLFGLLALGLVVVVTQALPPGTAEIAVVASLIASWLGQWVLRRSAADAVARSPSANLVWRWSFDADGIAFDNALQSNRLDWRAIKAVQEETDRYLFLVTPMNNPVLPKRLLSPEQIESLQALIAEVRASGRLGSGHAAGVD
jgi:hypothetical protein